MTRLTLLSPIIYKGLVVAIHVPLHVLDRFNAAPNTPE